MNPSPQNNIAFVILAAGSSSRLGKPKQLLPFRASNLLQSMINESLKIKGVDHYLSLGYCAPKIESQIHTNGMKAVFTFDNWECGLGSTIAWTTSKILQCASYKGICFMLTDQPDLNASLLTKILSAFDQERNNIVACKYQDGFGPPVLFGSDYFQELMDLSGDKGAKGILKSNSDRVLYISFPKGNIDIDTAEDLIYLT